MQGSTRSGPLVRVVIADDHHLVRQAIRALLDKARDIEVVGEAADGQQAVDLVARLLLDALVMDLATPRLNGSQAIGHIHTPDLRGDPARACLAGSSAIFWRHPLPVPPEEPSSCSD